MKKRTFLARVFVLTMLFALVLFQHRIRVGVQRHLAEAAESEPPGDVYARLTRAPYFSYQRPYTTDSPWNTPIPAGAEADWFSQWRIATLADTPTEGRLSLDSSRYTFTVYYADAETPRYTVPCVRYSCTVTLEDHTRHPRRLRSVPIPDEAQPSPGDDLMIIVDTVTGEEYGLYHPTRTEDGWQVDTAYSYSVYYDGAPASFGARAAGTPYLAGLVRPQEIREGRINHALAFGYPHVSDTTCVYPASKLDDGTRGGFTLPLGARLQLNPDLTEEDFDRMGLSETGKIIARALQEYGMILVEYSGAPKIYVEDLTNNPTAADSWDDNELKLRTWTLSKLPHTEFRVLALPDAAWNPFAPITFHGDCYR